MGYPPSTWTWDGVPPLPRPEMGYPPHKCWQTENITSRHPSDAGGNKLLLTVWLVGRRQTSWSSVLFQLRNLRQVIKTSIIFCNLIIRNESEIWTSFLFWPTWRYFNNYALLCCSPWCESLIAVDAAIMISRNAATTNRRFILTSSKVSLLVICGK